MSIVRLKATDGTSFEFDDANQAGSGGMKDVYFSKDKKQVIGWYRKKPDANSMERLRNIVGRYRENIFNQEGGAYWESLFCWPTHIVEDAGHVGVVMPTYRQHFFFEHGSKNGDFLSIKGKEKEGKWFASANHQQKHLDPRERGNWLSYFTTCIKIARSVGRLHMAGLAHSDLSYKNVLVDPAGGNACIIDIDTLVVPGRYPPDVVGTPDFIAPEVVSSLSLPVGDPKKMLPRIETDRHALAVLVYMYLLYRHPLRGRKVHHSDPQKDEELGMGKQALFIEHPSDDTNRSDPTSVKPGFLPFADTAKIPYAICGPYLRDIFDRAFITGLHAPDQRPTAHDIETALVKTVDLIQPCANPSCDQKWYVFDNSTKPKCPFCGTPFVGPLPVLNLYSSRGGGKFLPDNHRLMVYSNQYLYPWHVSRLIFPSAKLTDAQRKPVGYFVFHGGKWLLVNQSLPALKDADTGELIEPGKRIELKNDQKLLLSPEDGGRLVHVQMANV
ncbi:protein kinase-like protein [Roseimicrobium gellanilyticum]|uniref:Protein kinase-like protein n=1 Tax=Roseimicrobium gellanilyticum TaxID=748857 RepID=A0A366HQ66_9BACT|nr:serine/threonine-protein kinase [Roseimicrobium gellanilyticum]RBP44610.1 protein kinase-like protein [Roseimicrobium gellanilyticum]